MERVSAVFPPAVITFIAVSLTQSAKENVPTVIATATEKAEVMTVPIRRDPRVRFPQRYATVRMERNRIVLSDVDLYENRKPRIGDGLVQFRVGKEIGYADIDGRVVIQPTFERASHFSNGAALVVADRKYGYIKKDGTWLRKPTFDRAHHFSNGAALVVVEGKYGYIKKDGTFLREPTLDWAYDFREGYASASENGKYGLLNIDGVWHLEPQFERLRPLSGGLYAVRPNGEEGFFDPERLAFIVKGKLGAYHKPPKSRATSPSTAPSRKRRLRVFRSDVQNRSHIADNESNH